MFVWDAYIGMRVCLCTCVISSTTFSHTFHLMVTSWVSRNRCAERVWGEIFVRNQPLWRKGRRSKTRQGRTELPVRTSEASANQQRAVERVQPTQVTAKGGSGQAFIHPPCSVTGFGLSWDGHNIKRGGPVAEADCEEADSQHQSAKQGT